MARKVLLESTGYSYDNLTGKFTIPKYIPEERLILITDVTKNKVIYNFSDPSLGFTAYSKIIDTATANETTVVTLAYSGFASIGNGDEFQIIIDEDAQLYQPAETYLDPTNKERTTQPQALIDTDFEYGTQVTKWESIGLINNRPYSFLTANALANITDISCIQNTKLVTVTTSTAHNLVVGSPITVLDTYLPVGNGNFVVETIPTTTTFTYSAKALNTSTTLSKIFDKNKTSIVIGSIFSNAAIGGTPLTTSYTSGAVKVTTSVPHGLALGNEIAVVGYTGLTATSAYTSGGATSQATVVLADITRLYIGQSLVSGTGQVAGATITAITAGAGTTGTVTFSANFTVQAAGSYIFNHQGANGDFAVATITSPYVFTYYAPTNLTGALSATTATTTGTQALTQSTTITVASVAGIVVGSNISGYGIQPGTVVTAVDTTNLKITLSQVTVAALSSTTLTFSAAIYARPQAQFAHRPYDGGVLFSTNSSSNFVQATRQTRRYFRYQSGKAIQMSSGTVLKPYANLDNMVATGTTVTVSTKERHNLLPGTAIAVSGSTDTNFNGSFTVGTILSPTSFTYTTTYSFSANTVAPGLPALAVTNWYGAKSRLGIFDNQNGLFFEYDGQKLYAVRRSSVYQISGKINATYGSNTISQSDATFATEFAKQLVIGDYIVIRGISYRVTDIQSDTALTISPSYRGASTQFATISKTIDLRMPQTSWNIDRMDGTGPSGYNTDLSKMQMFYVDYTWYGAGFNRWGLRGARGNVQYAHKLPNNNVNTEAYMRSGNLPARYESYLIPPATITSAAIGTSDTVINVADTSAFPTSGTIAIRGVQPAALTITGITPQTVSTNLSAVSGDGTRLTATVTSTSSFAVGLPVTLSGTGSFNGTYTVESILSATSFTALTAITTAATISGATAVANTGYVAYSIANTSTLAQYMAVSITGSNIGGYNGIYPITTLNTNTSIVVPNSTTGTATTYGQAQICAVEYVNYTGTTSTSFTGLTRAQAGLTIVSFSIASGTSTATVGSSSGLQIGQRLYGTGLAENTFITNIVGTTVYLSQAATSTLSADATIIAAPMAVSAASNFAYSTTQQTAVELAWPSFAPAVSHWGTSVIMDGRYDDDKSLLFTYGQTTQTALQGSIGSITTPAAASVTISGTASSTGTTVTVTSTTTGLQPGMGITGTGGSGTIPANSYITAILSPTQFTLNAAPSPVLSGVTLSMTPGASGNSQITMSNIDNIVPGLAVTGTGVATNAYVLTVNASTKTITLSANNTAAITANTALTFTGGSATKALFSIRVAPSADNGVPANFGAREIVNRMQLILRALDITTAGPVGTTSPVNLLVTAILNGVPTSTTPWTNIIKGAANTANSSLAMIADYSPSTTFPNLFGTSVSGGETTGGFFTSGTTSIDLSQVRDLGNSILGGGGTTSNTNIYPDGPDTLTILVQNLSAVPVAVTGRLSWTEAQA